MRGLGMAGTLTQWSASRLNLLLPLVTATLASIEVSLYLLDAQKISIVWTILVNLIKQKFDFKFFMSCFSLGMANNSLCKLWTLQNNLLTTRSWTPYALLYGQGFKQTV